MTAAGIARLQDGRVTPENVRPCAKNPIIAGFFREIGRADRLGSGVRNLYKCKSTGRSWRRATS